MASFIKAAQSVEDCRASVCIPWLSALCSDPQLPLGESYLLPGSPQPPPTDSQRRYAACLPPAHKQDFIGGTPKNLMTLKAFEYLSWRK
ncbi:hypothetical protein CesoFtcFv8_013522 [Champsocephalus esox]|uniref:Uncharacterized protein n=1 Tax=Champsocephalus esox TaxID=159716 RepID=A0AAN8BRU1_9TELE|nr:hypothetical protein CesoFtcFv8_013522 [Champsocephalus esox]